MRRTNRCRRANSGNQISGVAGTDARSCREINRNEGEENWQGVLSSAQRDCGGDQERRGARQTGTAVRSSAQLSQSVEAAVSGACGGRIRCGMGIARGKHVWTLHATRISIAAPFAAHLRPVAKKLADRNRHCSIASQAHFTAPVFSMAGCIRRQGGAGDRAARSLRIGCHRQAACTHAADRRADPTPASV